MTTFDKKTYFAGYEAGFVDGWNRHNEEHTKLDDVKIEVGDTSKVKFYTEEKVYGDMFDFCQSESGNELDDIDILCKWYRIHNNTRLLQEHLKYYGLAYTAHNYLLGLYSQEGLIACDELDMIKEFIESSKIGGEKA